MNDYSFIGQEICLAACNEGNYVTTEGMNVVRQEIDKRFFLPLLIVSPIYRQIKMIANKNYLYTDPYYRMESYKKFYYYGGYFANDYNFVGKETYLAVQNEGNYVDIKNMNVIEHKENQDFFYHVQWLVRYKDK